MPKVIEVKGVREDKREAVARRAIRSQDVEPCHDCMRPADPAICGYDGRWRCLACNRAHGDMVLRESGDSAPNPGEATDHRALAVRRELGEKNQSRLVDQDGRPMTRKLDEARRASILRKYGIEE